MVRVVVRHGSDSADPNVGMLLSDKRGAYEMVEAIAVISGSRLDFDLLILCCHHRPIIYAFLKVRVCVIVIFLAVW